MQRSNGKWRKFIAHLGSYVIVIGALLILNLLTSPEFPWFLFPAAGWGAGLALHFVSLVSLNILPPRWSKFLRHLSVYVIIIGMLGIINLITSPEYPWFLFPALGWGVGIAFHLLGALLKTGQTEDVEEEELDISTEVATGRRRRLRRRAEAPAGVPQALKAKMAGSTWQAYVEKARAYQAQIEHLLQAPAAETAHSRPEELRGQVAEWVRAIEDLARRVDNFQQNRLIRQDLDTVPQAIAGLEVRVAQEKDGGIRSQLERTLASRRNQLAALERLRQTMHRAEIQIESTLSALGTVYSQLLTGQSTDRVADYSRLAAEAEEEVRTLQDQLEALEEVKLGRG